MFGVGTTEVLVVLAVFILLFGSAKVPQLARAVGSSLWEFKRGLSSGMELEKSVREEIREELEKLESDTKEKV